MFGGLKRDVTDNDMDEDYFGGTTWTSGVRVELPPPFRGDGEKPFAMWVKQFEAALRAQTRGTRSRSYTAALVNLLPTRLDGAAFLLWDTLPPDVQCDYERVKKLKDAFGRKQFLLYFQTCISAWPRQSNESLEVYAADVSRLMAEAFPDYDGAARNGETFRRLLAGLDPALQAKCHEQGATDVEEALTIAGRCEWARQALRASAPRFLGLVSTAWGSTESSGVPVTAIVAGLDADKLRAELLDSPPESRDTAHTLVHTGTQLWTMTPASCAP